MSVSDDAAGGCFAARFYMFHSKILIPVLSLMLARAEAQTNPAVPPPGPRPVRAAEASATRQTPNPPPAYPACVRVETNVPCLGPGREEKGDLYLPWQLPNNQRLPAIIIIHGGGFNDGDKARPREISIATNLVSGGYICLSINYHLRKREGEVTWPQPVYDAKAAVRWLRKNAARWQIDPDHIGVIGCSAGGHLAAMLALTRPKDGFDLPEPHGEFSSAVSCAVDFYGPVKLMEYHDMKMFGKTRAEAPELYERASPVNYASAGDAPMLIVHGTKDETVPFAQSEALAAALRQAGVAHEFIIVTNAPHSFNLMPPQQDLRPAVIGFLNKYLKPSASRAAGTIK